MDFQFVVLMALVAGTILLSLRLNARAWRRPGYQYQRVFSAGAAGLLFLISGLIGWDLRFSRGWFQGAAWVSGPVWWEVTAGIALLALAAFLARRVPLPPAIR